MITSKSITAVRACKGLSHFFAWCSGASFAAGHYRASVVAAFAAGICHALSYLLETDE